MPHAERTITINRSPDDVFAFFTDPAKDRSWRPHVKEIAAQGPAGVGAKIEIWASSGSITPRTFWSVRRWAHEPQLSK